jgi:hypothetical protein
MLSPGELEAPQRIPPVGITDDDIHTFGISTLFRPFTVSPKSVRLLARILLV